MTADAGPDPDEILRRIQLGKSPGIGFLGAGVLLGSKLNLNSSVDRTVIVH